MISNTSQPTLSQLLDEICRIFEIDKADLCGPSRKREFAYPRHLLCYICYHYTSHICKNVGLIMGDRDHTTVLNSTTAAGDLIDTKDDKFYYEYWLVAIDKSKMISELINKKPIYAKRSL